MTYDDNDFSKAAWNAWASARLFVLHVIEKWRLLDSPFLD